MKNIHLCWVALSATIVLSLGNFAYSQSNELRDPFAAASTDFQRRAPRIVDDAIMPKPDLLQRVQSWSRRAFSVNNVPDNSGAISLQLIRQDHSTLRFDQSCMATPLKIGSQSFAKGLGTHSNSEIRVTFPEPVTKFSAFVGIDNNYDTKGTHGSVQFAVLAGDRELVRTRTLRGSDEATAIDIILPEKTTVLTLIVDATADGPAHDQADWAEPTAFGVSGKIYYISDAESFPLNPTIPFSFMYNGINSSELLPYWTFDVKEIDDINRVYSWTDPKTGLKVSAQVCFASLEWDLYFENTGTQDNPPVENIMTYDMNVKNLKY